MKLTAPKLIEGLKAALKFRGKDHKGVHSWEVGGVHCIVGEAHVQLGLEGTSRSTGQYVNHRKMTKPALEIAQHAISLNDRSTPWGEILARLAKLWPRYFGPKLKKEHVDQVLAEAKVKGIVRHAKAKLKEAVR